MLRNQTIGRDKSGCIIKVSNQPSPASQVTPVGVPQRVGVGELVSDPFLFVPLFGLIGCQIHLQ
ncbi:MAG: hypothetical protein ACK4TO_08700 [Candidatus Nitrosotenuis sp.]